MNHHSFCKCEQCGERHNNGLEECVENLKYQLSVVKDDLATCEFEKEKYRKAVVEITGKKCRCEEYRNLLEDVVNELDLSDGMIELHGPRGTAPAELVRDVLECKNREISMLKAGMKRIEG